VYSLLYAAQFERADLAILRLEADTTNYLEIDFEQPLAGTDVVAFGISEHKIYGEGWELRTLKGHTTMPLAHWTQELSFPVPSGMSGGPLLVGRKCAGFLIANIRSEQLLERTEQIEEIQNDAERISLMESKQVLHYGLFRPFSIFHGKKSEVFEGLSLDEFILKRSAA